VKESYVQRQILDYLALKDIFHYRNNSGATYDIGGIAQPRVRSRKNKNAAATGLWKKPGPAAPTATNNH
jgi:hypothetical protein